MAFEKADRDGSGFLEPKELEMLIQGELLQDMSNKNAKVNRVIHDVVSRTIRYFSSHHHTEKIAFIDFLAVFDVIPFVIAHVVGGRGEQELEDPTQ